MYRIGLRNVYTDARASSFLIYYVSSHLVGYMANRTQQLCVFQLFLFSGSGDWTSPGPCSVQLIINSLSCVAAVMGAKEARPFHMPWLPRSRIDQNDIVVPQNNKTKQQFSKREKMINTWTKWSWDDEKRKNKNTHKNPKITKRMREKIEKSTAFQWYKYSSKYYKKNNATRKETKIWEKYFVCRCLIHCNSAL